MPIDEAIRLAEWHNGETRQSGNFQGGSLDHGMVIEPSDPAADRRALAKLGTWLQRFGPVVGIQQEEFPQSLLIEATHLAPLYGGEGELLHQLRLGIERLGLRTHIALADSIGAAWGVAHHPRTKGEGNCTTDGIPLGGQREALAPLPLSALRLEPALGNTLHQLGFGRVEDVLALPRDELDTRFGPQLRVRIEQALGNSHEAIDPIPPSGEFIAQWQLEHPTTRLAAVEKIVRLLVRQVAYQLESQGQGTPESWLGRALRLLAR